jgi:hypothetical protein
VPKEDLYKKHKDLFVGDYDIGEVEKEIMKREGGGKGSRLLVIVLLVSVGCGLYYYFR